jgi:Sulfotransferase domain
MLQSEMDIEIKGSGRHVPVQVLHLAMPRTGTLSMKAAYEKLGIPTYHGFDFIVNPEHQILWKRAIDAKYYDKGKPFTKADFDAFLGDYGAMCDMPSLGF